MLCKGFRSLGFELQANVDRALQDGHPDPERLQLPADILTKDTDMQGLCAELNGGDPKPATN